MPTREAHAAVGLGRVPPVALRPLALRPLHSTHLAIETTVITTAFTTVPAPGILVKKGVW